MKKMNFALIELAVLVFATAVLGCMLINVMSTLRAGAQAAGCLDNLKKQGQGIAKYVADNRGVQPTNNGGAGSETGFRQTYAFQIAEYVEPEYAKRFAYRKKITAAPSIFMCPGDAIQDNQWYPMSYGTVRMNLFPYAKGEYPFLITYDKIKNPADLFAVMDANHSLPTHPAGTNGIQPPWYLNPKTKQYVARATFVKDLSGDGVKESYAQAKDKNSVWYFNGANARHNMCVNALFVDGHVAANNESEFVKDVHWKVIMK